MQRGAQKFYFQIIILLLSFTVKAENIPSVWPVQQSNLPNQSWYLFPDSRENITQWDDSLRTEWLQHDYSVETYELVANPGEAYVFQVIVWAAQQALSNVSVTFFDFKSINQSLIPASRFTCFNTGGVDYLGRKMTKQVNLTTSKVQPLWMGVDLSNIQAGIYSGEIQVIANNVIRKVKIRLNVQGEYQADKGLGVGKNLSRLFWLNSTLGHDENYVAKGFQPIQRRGNTIDILGRSLTIAANGLPDQILSYFAKSNESLQESPEPLLSQPFRFIVEKSDGSLVALQPGTLKFTEQTSSFIKWEVTNTSDICEINVRAKMEFDGHVDYTLEFVANTFSYIKDIRMETYLNNEKAVYMMGIGKEGGFRPTTYEWKWKVATKRQDNVWLGAVNGGLDIKLKSDNYRQPIVLANYPYYPLLLPDSWGNFEKGGISISQTTGQQVLVKAYSGDRIVNGGDVLYYNFELLITPFKLINRETKYGDRYYHSGVGNTFLHIDPAVVEGCNILNLHHAQNTEPFINYPTHDASFPLLKQLVGNAQKKNLLTKVYYTTRELSTQAHEFFPFFSMDGEIIVKGPGNNYTNTSFYPDGPPEWLKVNLRKDYIPAWMTTIKDGQFKNQRDYSVITRPESRLNNYFVEGLDYMLKESNIDGFYIDDTHIDRVTMKRCRKLIDQYRPNAKIDLHSYNHFQPVTASASSLNMYLDILPYLDLVWIGEARNYDKLSDVWLVEVSGIPFGLPGQMLKDGGNRWRGMVYGITNRSGRPVSEQPSPKALWLFFDQYKFENKTLLGFWDNNCPVVISNENVKASLFKGEDVSIIAVANWSDVNQTTQLTINWNKLGYNESTSIISIPYISDYQQSTVDFSLESLEIPAKQGYLIVIKNNNYNSVNDLSEKINYQLKDREIFFDDVEKSVSLYDIQGRKLYSKTPFYGSTSYQFGQAGLYVAKVDNKIVKLIVQ